jgi:hypothetical protein
MPREHLVIRIGAVTPEKPHLGDSVVEGAVGDIIILW